MYYFSHFGITFVIYIKGVLIKLYRSPRTGGKFVFAHTLVSLDFTGKMIQDNNFFFFFQIE